MQRIRIFQVDAFADRLFAGNPAAVCLLNGWPGDDLLQSIAAENNLAETAYLVKRDGFFEIRWFTPTLEVELCGHATLASAFVIFEILKYASEEVIFHTTGNIVLRVYRENDLFILDFPAETYASCDALPGITKGIGRKPAETYSGRYFYMAVLDREEDVSAISPDLKSVGKLDKNGLIVTAPGRQVDFVSRFFAPQSGIDEDPVTGSAHTMLIPYWSHRLKRTKLEAKQLSSRGGHLHCTDNGSGVLIGGKARLFMEGEIILP